MYEKRYPIAVEAEGDGIHQVRVGSIDKEQVS